MSAKILPVKTYLQTWLALLVLLAVTVGAAFLPLGPFNVCVALAIAALKALIIVLIFMHIRWGSKLLHLAAFSGILWLAILISMVVVDYATRSWIPYGH